MKTKKFQQIALPLTGLFLFSLSSCAIEGNAEASSSSSLSSISHIAEYNLVSSTLEGMKETFNVFFTSIAFETPFVVTLLRLS